MIPEQYKEEEERLKETRSFSVINSSPEEEYDNITKIAAYILDVPVSLITLVDEDTQWFKSNHGTEVKEIPRDIAFCTHVFNNPESALVVEDASKDDRFKDNPLVTEDPKIRFYAGIPLVSNGYPIGSICVLDTEPRKITEDKVETLRALANQTMQLLFLRKKNKELEQAYELIQHQNKELQTFIQNTITGKVNPLKGIVNLCKFYERTYHNTFDDRAEIIFEEIKEEMAMLKVKVEEFMSNV